MPPALEDNLWHTLVLKCPQNSASTNYEILILIIWNARSEPRNEL